MAARAGTSTESVNDPDDAFMLRMSAMEIQQEYYEAIGDADWERYEKNERQYLLQKIAIALCGPPKIEGNLKSDSDEIKLQGYELRDEEQAMTVFNKICEQAKYSHNGENILVSVLRVVCVAPTEEIPFHKLEPKDYWLDLHLKRGKEITICIFHVFSIRKCISQKNGERSCRMYIDHEGRVYQNWQRYLEENNLPKSIMVVPEHGEYRCTLETVGNLIFTEGAEVSPEVRLEVHPTPALGVKARILSATDTASVVGNISALAGVVIGAASLPLMPVVAPVAFGVAGSIAAVTGIYGIVRSSIHLADRGNHEQSISLQNSEARASWLNITLSAAGLSFSAAGRLLSMAASSGTDVQLLINAFRVLRYTNMVTGFIGVANSLGDMINKFYTYNEKPTTMELFQFTSSALFFGLGVMSNQTAQEIVQDAQAKTINQMRDQLSSKMKRKMFDKVTAETRRVKGTIQGNTEVIRGLNKIDSKNEFFAKIGRMNKDLNKNKVRISLAPDGQPLFNNEHKISITELSNLGKKGRQQLFTKYGPANITTKNVPTRIYPSNAAAGSVNTNQNDLSVYIRPEELIKISTFLLRLSQVDKEFVAEILSQMSKDLHYAFMLLCAELFTALAQGEMKILSDSGSHFLVRLVYFVFDYIKSRRVFGECDYENDNAFQLVIKEFFQDGGIKRDTILLLKSRFIEWLAQLTKKDQYRYVFEDLGKFKKMFEIKYKVLEANKVMKIGAHNVLIKQNTVDLISEWAENYCQDKCDIFVQLCFKIIAQLNSKELDLLVFVNPDEDVLMIVAKYLKENSHLFDNLLDFFLQNGEVDENVAKSLAKNILKWCSQLNLRTHWACDLCKGIRYA